MIIRILVFLSILAFIFYYTGSRSIPLVPVSKGVKISLWVVLSLGLVSLPLYFTMLLNQMRFEVTSVTAWFAFSVLGLVSILFCLLFVFDISVTMGFLSSKGMNAAGLSPNEIINQERREFLSKGLYQLAAGISIFVFGVGFLKALRLPAVKKIKIQVKELPGELKGIRIAQISDIHIGATIKKGFLQGVVDRVNQLKPDIIAITGDLVDGSVKDLAPHVEPLKNLKARLGSYFVTGNHEYYSGAGPWVKHVESLGIRVLSNSNEILSFGGARLLLAGVTDYSTRTMQGEIKTDPKKAIESQSDSHLKILLAHQPKSIVDAHAAGFDIQLSGHTHGGQYFPFNFLVHLFQPFVAGHYNYKGTQLYVNSGTGYWGPPVRFGATSEITEIQLA